MMDKIGNEKLNELFYDHLTYEISMWMNSYDRASVLGDDVVAYNAMLEDFSLHSHVLIRFLKGAGQLSPQAFAPKYSLRPERLARERERVWRSFLRKFKDQMLYIGPNRVAESSEKINGDVRAAVYRVTVRELKRFTEKLLPEYKPSWEFYTDG